MSNQNNKPTVITVKGVTYNFPSVPKPTIEQKLASLPPTPTHNIKNISSTMPDIKTLRAQANAKEIAEAFKPRPQLEQNLAEARRKEEAMREVQEKARREEEAKREAELYAEFAKLEKEYPNNCKKDKNGKCTIMGGVKKTRKGSKKSKKSKKRSRKSKRRH
jgi:hypothetical protein